MNSRLRNLPLRDWGQLAMAHLGDDLAQVPISALRSPVPRGQYHAGLGMVFLASMIAATPNAKSQNPPTCRTEPLLPTAPGTFGARPGSILSPGHRRSVHSLLSPPRALPRCPPEAEFEPDVQPPPPSQLHRALVVPNLPKTLKPRDDRVDQPIRKRAGRTTGERLGSTARTQQALVAIGIPPDRTDGVLSNKTTDAIASYQALLGAPTTGRLTKGQRELLWELSAAAKK